MPEDKARAKTALEKLRDRLAECLKTKALMEKRIIDYQLAIGILIENPGMDALSTFLMLDKVGSNNKEDN